MTQQVFSKEAQRLVKVARQYNRTAVRLKKDGYDYAADHYKAKRERVMGRARKCWLYFNASESVAPEKQGIQDVLADIAEAVCLIDHRKNDLPGGNKPQFLQMVEEAHSHIRAIADYHGVVIYDDQREQADAKQTH